MVIRRLQQRFHCILETGEIISPTVLIHVGQDMVNTSHEVLRKASEVSEISLRAFFQVKHHRLEQLHSTENKRSLLSNEPAKRLMTSIL